MNDDQTDSENDTSKRDQAAYPQVPPMADKRGTSKALDPITTQREERIINERSAP